MTTVQPATVYYNEIDPYCCQWLKNLIAAGELPPGDVDCRSIVDVKPEEVAHYTQRHWFAGIGGWPMALQLAGWGDRPVDTGSAPCQPFSTAGKRQGTADARHLWPAFFRLIRARRPECIFGEQVGGAAGRAWLAGVFADLDAIGYRTGAVDLPAASVGAPHIRQRLYWVAYTNGRQSGNGHVQRGREYRQQPQDGGADDRLADTSPPGRGTLLRTGRTNRRPEVEPDGHGNASRLEQPPSHGRQQGPPEPGGRGTQPRRGAGGLGDAERGGLNGHARRRPGHELTDASPWAAAILIPCADGRARRVKPGIFPLVDGLPLALDGRGPISRVGALRGAGNAIVPHVAAAFISAFMDCERR